MAVCDSAPTAALNCLPERVKHLRSKFPTQEASFDSLGRPVIDHNKNHHFYMR